MLFSCPFVKFLYIFLWGCSPWIYGEKMNLENLNVLSQKVDGVLSTVRGLRQEVSSLKVQLAEAQSGLQDRESLLQTANASLAECKAALDVEKSIVDNGIK